MSFSFSIYVSLFSFLSTFLILPLCLPWDLTSACRGLHRNPALPAGDLACSVPAGKGQGLCMPRVSSLRRCWMSQRVTGHKPAHGWAHLMSGAIFWSRWLWWTQGPSATRWASVHRGRWPGRPHSQGWRLGTGPGHSLCSALFLELRRLSKSQGKGVLIFPGYNFKWLIA